MMFEEIINGSAGLIREHSWTLCMAWTASLLVIYGGSLAKFTKKIACSWNFGFRVMFFVVVCGFGYGFLSLFIARLIHPQMLKLSNLWMDLSVLVAFLLLGFLAEKRKMI